jgi:hypothetical protein
MAPFTRLREHPARRIDYRPGMATGRLGSARDPILIDNTPLPQEKPKRSAKTKQKAVSKPSRNNQGRFKKSEGPTNAKSSRSKVAKSAPPPKETKPRPDRTECTICATTKNTKRSFKASSLVDTCEHFESICDQCIQKQIKTRMAANQLTEAQLPCMFPQCEIVLDHSALKMVMSKGLFERYVLFLHSLDATLTHITAGMKQSRSISSLPIHRTSPASTLSVAPTSARRAVAANNTRPTPAMARARASRRPRRTRAPTRQYAHTATTSSVSLAIAQGTRALATAPGRRKTSSRRRPSRTWAQSSVPNAASTSRSREAATT